MTINTDQFVTAQELLDLLFSDRCRPNIRWLHKMKKMRRVPYHKIHGKLFFDPEEVRAYWRKKGVIRAV